MISKFIFLAILRIVFKLGLEKAWPKIEVLAKDEKLRTKALSNTLKTASRDLNPQIQNG